MNKEIHNSISAFVWKIADEVLRDNGGRADYQKVILPMLVLRRFDLQLGGKMEAVMKEKEMLEKRKRTNIDEELCYAAGQPFYNTSGYTLENMRGKTGGRLQADFNKYLKGFSPAVQEILDNFEFYHLAKKLHEKGLLLALIGYFLDSDLELQKLDNHEMGTVFEELVRQFSEEANEEAGAYWTPRDAVGLMTQLVFSPTKGKIKNGTYNIYDGACGTGGMLTVAEDTLKQIGKDSGENRVKCNLHGQEKRADIYAICKADMLLRSSRTERKDKLIHFGSTLSEDHCADKKFRFMLSNPPFGTHWKKDKEKIDGEGGVAARFSVQHRGESLSIVPRISDGQMLFLVNLVRKMSQDARIAEVHNGSSLFAGDAGSGESNIRRWLIENDWLEAVIALPENMFYNTGITTYIWVIANNKTKKRQGKIQLIDAGEWFTPLRRNLGKKNCELGGEDIQKIMSAFWNFGETEKSKIFPNEEFGYRQITVHRPLRLRGQLSDNTADAAKLRAEVGGELFNDYNVFRRKVREAGKRLKIPAGKINAVLKDSSWRDANAPLVEKENTKHKSANPLYGVYEETRGGKKVFVEYEPDSELKDTERVPLLHSGGVAAFIEREVRPYAPDVWVEKGTEKIGYEISFNRYFYRPQALRELTDIRGDIDAVEKNAKELLNDLLQL